MSFAFGFAGDDIDTSVDSHDETVKANATSGLVNGASSVPVISHELDQLLDTLPSRISYDVVRIQSPSGRITSIPRRELFDVRQQLMAEDDDETLRSLETTDLRTDVYEGGFKTWECSIDLASLLLDRAPAELGQVEQVIELGAGSALPSLILFQHALQHSLPVAFTLADFNSAVLRLVTLPNLFLTYALHVHGKQEPPLTEASSHDDLEITPELLAGFKTAVKLQFVSGPWSAPLLDLIRPPSTDRRILILAAETIYSPASTVAFVDLVVQLLRRTARSKAFVAAKRMYFGIGGSVNGFREVCREKGADANEMEDSGVIGMEQGVGRALIEIRMDLAR